MIPVIENALGVIYLTELQRRMYRSNPFYREPRHMVLGCSVFSSEFFDRVDAYQASAPHQKDIEVSVAYSAHTQKGYDLSLKKAKELSSTPYTMKNLTPNEVLDVLERSETFIHLPRWVEPCGRMPIEARFLGNKVIGNSYVGAIEETWWKLPDEEALEFVRTAPERFWASVDEIAKGLK